MKQSIILNQCINKNSVEWADIINMQKGEIHRTLVYVAPFAKCDREKDYEVAWVEFEKIQKEKGNLNG